MLQGTRVQGRSKVGDPGTKDWTGAFQICADNHAEKCAGCFPESVCAGGNGPANNGSTSSSSACAATAECPCACYATEQSQESFCQDFGTMEKCTASKKTSGEDKCQWRPSRSDACFCVACKPAEHCFKDPACGGDGVRKWTGAYSDCATVSPQCSSCFPLSPCGTAPTSPSPTPDDDGSTQPIPTSPSPTTPSAPNLQRAEIVGTGSTIHVTLAAPTSRAASSGLNNPVECGDMITSSATFDKCEWVTAYILSIGSFSNVVAGTTNITLVVNALPAEGSTDIPYGSGTVTIEISSAIQSNPLRLTLAGPSLIGPCDNFAMDIILVGAVGKNAVITGTWRFGGITHIADNLMQYTSEAGSSGGRRLVLPSILLDAPRSSGDPAARAFSVTVNVTNSLGERVTATKMCRISPSPVPLLRIVGGQARTTKRSTASRIAVAARRVRICNHTAPAARGSLVVLEWKAKLPKDASRWGSMLANGGGGGTEWGIDPRYTPTSEKGRILIIPAFTLMPGTYELEVSVSETAASSSSSSSPSSSVKNSSTTLTLTVEKTASSKSLLPTL